MIEETRPKPTPRTEKQKARGRIASQKHRQSQKAKGVPNAHEIDGTIGAFLMGRTLRDHFHIPAHMAVTFAREIAFAGGWDANDKDVVKAVHRRCKVMADRYQSLRFRKSAAHPERSAHVE